MFPLTSLATATTPPRWEAAKPAVSTVIPSERSEKLPAASKKRTVSVLGPSPAGGVELKLAL